MEVVNTAQSTDTALLEAETKTRGSNVCCAKN